MQINVKINLITMGECVVNENKLGSFKSSEHINEKGDGPYRGFVYLSLFSDPIVWQHGAEDNHCNFASFNSVVDTKTSKFQMGSNILKYII